MKIMQLIQELDRCPSNYKMAVVTESEGDILSRPTDTLSFFEDIWEEMEGVASLCGFVDDPDDALTVSQFIETLTDFIEENKDYMDPSDMEIVADMLRTDIAGVSVYHDYMTIGLITTPSPGFENEEDDY